MPIRPKAFNRGNIYLSGGMQFAKDLGADWRTECSQKLKAMQYFPLDITELDVAYAKKFGKPILPDKSHSTTEQDILLYKAQFRRHFIDTDTRLIDEQTDAVILHYDESARRGAGTISEAQYAFTKKIPIFLVCTEYETMQEFYLNTSAWLIGLTTKIFINWEDLYAYLNNLPHGIIKKDIYGNTGIGGKYLCHLSGEVFVKNKGKFVSKIEPLYSQNSVATVVETYEETPDRYEFFMDYLEDTTDAPFKSHK